MLFASLAFLAIIFATVWARRFGPRGMALGMIAFMSYIFSMFFHARMALFPWMCACIGISLACAFLIRFALIRDNQNGILQWTLIAFLARARICLRLLADAAARGHWDRVRRTITRNAAQLNETALDLEDSLQPGAMRAVAPDIGPEDLRARIFDAELYATCVMNATRRVLLKDVDLGVRETIVDAVLAARRMTPLGLSARSVNITMADEGAVAALEDFAHDIGDDLVHDLAVVLLDFAKAAYSIHLPAPDVAPAWKRHRGDQQEKASSRGSSPNSTGRLVDSLHPATRQALQTAFAGLRLPLPVD